MSCDCLRCEIVEQPHITLHIVKDGSGGDKFFEFSQMSPAAVWLVEHPLRKFPSVTVVDSGGSAVIGDVDYIDDANIRITFQSAFAGKAYLN